MDKNTTQPNDTALPEELRQLLASDDKAAFETALDSLLHQREQNLFKALGHLARDLNESVKRLADEVSGPAEDSNVTDVRDRLHEVLDMSAKAAHHNLEMVEELRPQATQLSGRARALADAPEAEFRSQALALATLAENFASRSGARFSQIIETQSWQDLAGQRVKKVVTFIDKVEASLLELVRLTGSLAGNKNDTAIESTERATTQEEVDRLLAEFGF